MKEGGIGGERTITGLHFEKKTDLLTIISGKSNYTVKGNAIYYNNLEVARSYKKKKFYKLLEEKGITRDRVPEKTLEPDNALYVLANSKVFIIEVKFQKVSGSVDEKLQTCHYKKQWYEKLLKPIGLEVEFIFVLNDWFKSSKYKEILEYIRSVGCDYFFETLPLGRLGLPEA